MGMFDTVEGTIECPYCEERFEIDIQLKAFNIGMSRYQLNDFVIGGPYLDGSYARHTVECQFCKKVILPYCMLKGNVIKRIRALKGDNFEDFEYDFAQDKLWAIE